MSSASLVTFKSFSWLQRPEVIFHLAKQPKVSESAMDPGKTFSTNAVRHVFDYKRNSNCREIIKLSCSNALHWRLGIDCLLLRLLSGSLFLERKDSCLCPRLS